MVSPGKSSTNGWSSTSILVYSRALGYNSRILSPNVQWISMDWTHSNSAMHQRNLSALRLASIFVLSAANWGQFPQSMGPDTVSGNSRPGVQGPRRVPPNDIFQFPLLPWGTTNIISYDVTGIVFTLAILWDTGTMQGCGEVTFNSFLEFWYDSGMVCRWLFWYVSYVKSRFRKSERNWIDI